VRQSVPSSLRFVDAAGNRSGARIRMRSATALCRLACELDYSAAWRVPGGFSKDREPQMNGDNRRILLAVTCSGNRA
jgi:hypothetical protein